MGFGDRVIGSQTAGQSITISNIGGAPATLSMLPSTIDYLITGGNCGPTLAAQASCTAQIAFRPLGFGLRIGSFVVNSNAAGSPHTVDVSGTGCRPFLGLGSRLGSRANCAP